MDLIFDNHNITISETISSFSDLESQLSEFDCFIINLPEEEIEDVLTAIMESDKDIPRIPILDHESDWSVDRLLDAGANDVVSRDERIDWKQVLANRIKTLVGYSRDGESTRYRTIMEAIEDGIYTLDDDFRITWVNEAATAMLGYEKEELIGAHSTMLTDEATLEEAAQISYELRAGERDMGRLETQIEPANGDSFPIETHFTLLPLADDDVGQVGVFRDISERKEYERTLTELYHSTRELLGADSKTEICEIISTTAAEVLELPAVVVYLLGEESTELNPVATNVESADILADAPPIQPADDSTAWNVFVEEDSSFVSDFREACNLEHMTNMSCSGLVVPLGEFGVFVAGTEKPTFDIKHQRLIDLLCTATISALESIEKQDTIQDRDRELTQQARQLTKLHHINDTIRKVQQSLVQANTRDEIEESVVDQLANDDRIEFVYIGELQPDCQDIVPRTWAGNDKGYLDKISTEINTNNEFNTNNGEPAIMAAEQQEPIVIDDIGAELKNKYWRKTALSKGYRSVISVPLLHNELLYGVLTVFSNRPSVVGRMSQEVFSELGETIGYAINSIQSKRSLGTDSTVELEIQVSKPDELLIRIAEQSGQTLTFQNVIPQPDGSSLLNFLSPEPLEGNQTLSDEIMAVEDISFVADHEDGNVYEAKVNGKTIANTLIDYGAAICSIVANGDQARTIVELPSDTDVRSFIEIIQRSYSDTELLSRRTIDPNSRSQQDLLEDIEDRLTDRQFEVLRTAFFNGYFQWPRERTGEEVASSLGIAQPTFNRHLRESERKLFELLFSD